MLNEALSHLIRESKRPPATTCSIATMAVEDGDVTLVPKRHHPCATTHGYDLYYLNVMAGPKRMWKFHNAPEHAWMLA